MAASVARSTPACASFVADGLGPRHVMQVTLRGEVMEVGSGEKQLQSGPKHGPEAAMTVAVYVSIYLGLLIFIAGCIRRVMQYARAPVHLRWELYPVPHEDHKRAAHGGSSFETSNRWTRPPHFNWRGELRATLPEIAFLKGLWEFNRQLWYASFLFHAGLYLTIATGLLIAAVAWLGGPSHASLAYWMRGLYRAAAYAGVVLTLCGAVALLFHRLTDPELKNYTSAPTFSICTFSS